MNAAVFYEIPAFAGMVCEGNGELWAYFAGGMRGERESIGEYGIVAACRR